MDLPRMPLLSLVFLVVVSAVPTGPARGGIPSQRVTVRTDDGLQLAATFYETPSRPAPAVVYVHQLQKGRKDWDAVASQLAAEGIAGLAVDLRGHGESPGSPQDYSGMVQDVRAARRFLAARAEVAPGRLGMAGASLGATLSAIVAADEASVVSLALLSPAMEYRGLRLDAAMKKYAARPALLVASDTDGYSARTVKELQKAGGGVRQALVLTNAGHGTAMLTGDAGLGRQLLEWFRRTLL
jgi:alpha-beta hydrolase superfamily lysophospholipase